MKIWLTQIGEYLPIDGEEIRLMRTGILANKLSEQGHNVVWWASTFSHKRKAYRADCDKTIEMASNYVIKLIHAPSYKKDVSLARIRNHRILAKRFELLARREVPPDIILCSFPTIELAKAAVDYGKEKGVPVLIDVRDMWPDTIAYLLPKWARPLAYLALAGMKRQASAVCANATAILGHAPGFVEWGLRYGKRTRTDLDRDFPFGYVDKPPSAEAIVEAEKFWEGCGVKAASDQMIICYAGAIGHQVRLKTVLEAARLLRGKRPIKFVFCGDGDMRAKFKRETAGLPDVLFVGFLEAPKLWTLMRRSSMGLVCIKGSPDYLASIPNKVPEYLSAGLPIVSNFAGGVVYDMIMKHNIGFSYEDNPLALSKWIIEVYDRPEILKAMSDRALKLFRERFVAKGFMQK